MQKAQRQKRLSKAMVRVLERMAKGCVIFVIFPKDFPKLGCYVWGDTGTRLSKRDENALFNLEDFRIATKIKLISFSERDGFWFCTPAGRKALKERGQ